MKELIDIHTVLSTPEDIEDYHDDPGLASDCLNFILHTVYSHADEDIEPQKLEKILQHTWEFWYRDQQLTEIDEVDLADWVDQMLATWDDSDLEPD